MSNHHQHHRAPSTFSSASSPTPSSPLSGMSGPGKNRRLLAKVEEEAAKAQQDGKALFIIDGKNTGRTTPALQADRPGGPIQRRIQRARARRRYRAVEHTVDAVLEDLYVIGDPDKRAGLLDHAAVLLGDLAGLHTTAWGHDTDGQSAVASIECGAVLLRQVAGTERAVFTTPLMPGSAAEAMAWAALAGTAERTDRADLLIQLGDLVTPRLGERAAEMLAWVADTEVHLGCHGPGTPRQARQLPRAGLAAVFVLFGAVIAIDDDVLAGRVRGALALAVLAGAAVWLWAWRRWEIRCTTTGRRLGSAAHRRAHLLPASPRRAALLMLARDPSRGRCHPRQLRLVRRERETGR